MNLYTDKGYLDMGAVLSAPHPFIIIIGARGCGKTYGALKYVIEQRVKFLYLRRTKTILDMITDKRYSPFKKINEDLHYDIQPEVSKGYGIYTDGDTGSVVGYAAALSTIANLRGFDGSDIELLIWDEFIPEPSEISRFNEFSAFANAYETINRNREFEGRPALKAVLMSNSDLLYSPVVSGLNIADDLVRMQEEKLEVLQKSKDILLIRPDSPKFYEQKKDTVLYRVTEGSGFSDMALKNLFTVEDRSRIKERPIQEYNPIALYKGICIYKHKSGSSWYVSEKISGSPAIYQDTEAEKRRYLREQTAIWRAFNKRKVYFENVRVQSVFLEIYK